MAPHAVGHHEQVVDHAHSVLVGRPDPACVGGRSGLQAHGPRPTGPPNGHHRAPSTGRGPLGPTRRGKTAPTVPTMLPADLRAVPAPTGCRASLPPIPLAFPTLLARVAELADAQDSGSCVRKDVRVQVPPRAPPSGPDPAAAVNLRRLDPAGPPRQTVAHTRPTRLPAPSRRPSTGAR